MNITLIITFAVILVSFVVTVFRDISMSTIFNLDAFLIVIGGTSISLLVGFPTRRISDTIDDVIKAYSKEKNKEDLTRDIVAISKLHGKATIRDIEKKMEDIDDTFLKLGINLLINAHNKNEIKEIMEREMMIRIMRYNFSQNLLNTIARLTPSFGLAGTVISLIKMFGNFKSIDTIAPMITVALMSTLYGVIIANLIMVPLSSKLKEKAILSETIMKITIDGIMAIHDMEHPLKVEDRVSGYRDLENAGMTRSGSTFIPFISSWNAR